jgi:AcrR family transcriptional regulator
LADVDPTPTPKRQARSVARLRQILDESLACFAEQGFERAT